MRLASLFILAIALGLSFGWAAEPPKTSNAFISQASASGARPPRTTERPEQSILDQVRVVYSKKVSPNTTQALGYFQRGLTAWAQEQYAQARNELSRPMIAQETALGDYALFYLAASQVERPAVASQLLEKLIIQYPDSHLVIPAKIERAWVEKEAGRFQAAAALLNEPAVLKGSPFAMMMLGECYERLNQTAAAAALYEKVYYEWPASKEADLAAEKLQSLTYPGRALNQPAERGMLRAEALIKAARYRDALATLESLALRRPSDLSMDALHLKQGICYYYLKKYAQAKDSLGLVSPKKPEHHAEALYYRFQCARKPGSDVQPESVLQTLIERYPRHRLTESALYLQAAAYEVKPMPEKAHEIYQQIITEFPAGVYCERALWKTLWLDYSEGRYEKAARGFLDYVRRFPDGPNNLAALYWAGRSYEKLKQRDAAAYLYREVRARTLNWYGLLAEKQLRPMEKGRARPEKAGPAALMELIDRVRLREPSITVAANPLSYHLEKIRQLRLIKLDGLALQELEVLGGLPAARADFLKADVVNGATDHLRWMRAFSKLLPNYYLYHSDELPLEVWKILFPLHNWTKIKAEATKYQIDPYLLCALIRQESAYNPKAVSSAKAVGLTQILPSTGRQIARKLGYRKFTTSRLYEPSVNIAFGAYFLSNMIQRYGGRVESALAAYNGGPGRMDAWSQRLSMEDINEMVESIPITETRNYVKSIIAMRERYRNIYGALRDERWTMSESR